MSITSGFFNALNGDREYTASQMSQLFDGIIVDGVFPSIGTCFVATVGTGLSINIGIGKSWFRQSWLYNDSILPVAIPGSEVVLDRIDAIVMEFNDSESIRDNTIKLISGTPSSTPERPILTNNSDILQKPICFVLRPAGSITILPEHITNMIGTKDVPFVTGILKHFDIDVLLTQWNDKSIALISDLQEAIAKAYDSSLYSVCINDTATFLAAGWSSEVPYTQTVAAKKMAELYQPIVDVSLSGTTIQKNSQLDAFSCISEIRTGSGTITATCLDEKPSIDITVKLKAVV